MIADAKTEAKYGERVLICNKDWESQIIDGIFKPKYGTVQKQYLTDGSYHGSSFYETITIVLGDDGKIYNDDDGNRFFTEKEFINEINYKIQKERKAISNANQHINIFKQQLYSISIDKV